MSVEKVQKYKEEKARRKEILAKEKRKKFWTKIGLWVLCIAIIAGLGAAVGVTLYNKHQAYLAALPDYNRTQMVVSDMAGILESESESEEPATEPQTNQAE